MNSVPSIVLSFIAAGVGGYIGSYLRKKGENRAIREDLDQLIEQVRKTTETAKAIEARISNEMWDSQRRWELKREVLFDTVLALGQARTALVALIAAHDGHIGSDGPSELLVKATFVWNTEINNYDEKRSISLLVCGPELDKALQGASMAMRRIALKLFGHEAAGDNVENASAMELRLAGVRRLVRAELGFQE